MQKLQGPYFMVAHLIHLDLCALYTTSSLAWSSVEWKPQFSFFFLNELIFGEGEI